MIPKEHIDLMQAEIRAALDANGYRRKRYISRDNILFYLQERGSPWVMGLAGNYRGRLVTATMLKMGWRPFSGNPSKCIRSFARG